MDNNDPDITTPAILRLDDPAELLAYLPYRIGFWPTESAVLLSLRGDQASGWRPGLVARVDLADIGADTHGEHLRTELLNHLYADGARLTFLVIYTATGYDDVRRGRSAAGRTLTWWLAQPEIADASRAWVVSPERYRCVECRQEPCCPDQGHHLQRLESSAIAAEMIYQGMSYAPSRDQVLPVPAPDPQTRARVVRASGKLRRQRIVRGAHRQEWLDELTRRWDRFLAAPAALDREGVSGTDLAALIVALEEVAVRDAVLVAVATGVSVARARGPAGIAMLDQVFSPRGPAPQQDRLHRATEGLLYLSGLTARGRSASIWAVLAWLAWFEGNGARADLCLVRCAQDDPDHRLAMLIRRAVDHGIPPGWARAGTAA